LNGIKKKKRTSENQREQFPDWRDSLQNGRKSLLGY
jgi:hypothetical protein